MILRTVSIYVFSLPSCCSSSLRALAVAVVAVTAVTERERERERVYMRKLTVYVCARTDQCKNAINTATQTAFLTLTSSNAEFDFFCEN